MKKSTPKKQVKVEKTTEKKLKFKLVLYFLIGLLFQLFGLIIAGLWIKFKSKLNKGAKFKALLLGFVITLLISLSGNLSFVKSIENNFILAKFPEVKPVYLAVENAYPDYDIGYNISYTTFYSNSGTHKASTLTITLGSTKDFPHDSEYVKVGKLVCTTLNKEDKHMDEVSIHFGKEYKLLGITLFNSFYGYSGSCTSWLGKE